MSERRLLQRFSLEAPAVVKTLSKGQETVFTLRTKDISSRGAFFPMEVPLPRGERVKITLLLSISALEEIGEVANTAQIVTEGQVVRSTEQGMAVEFAEHYTMTPAAV